MPQHFEKRILNFPPAQLYNLVLDVEKYPDFVPWCTAVTVTERGRQHLIVDLSVGYKIFNETYTSRVKFYPRHRIDVIQEKGPFEHLKTTWEFKEHPQGCELIFKIDFKFKYQIFQSAIDMVFMEIMHMMIQSFESRARLLKRLSKE